MFIRFLIAAAAVVAVPIAAAGQTDASRKAPREKRYCEARNDLQSRLSSTRRCFTKAQWDARKHEARVVVDRIQTMKATTGR